MDGTATSASAKHRPRFEALTSGCGGGFVPSFGSNGDAGRSAYAELRRRDVGHVLAAQTAGSACGPWRLSNSPALSIAMSNAFFSQLGLPSLVPQPTA